MEEIITNISTTHLRQAMAGMFTKENPLTAFVYGEAWQCNVTVKTVWINIVPKINAELLRRQ